MLIGLALRTVAIGRESLWTDEALTTVLAQWPVWDMITKPTDPTPFFYYALHKWFIPDGAGVVGVRSISLVAGILALPAIYAIGRLIFSREGALLATALLAVSAPLIDYSQEARAYSLLVLLVLVSAASLIWWSKEVRTDGARSDRGNRRPYGALALFFVATSLSLYTHFVANFWVAPALLILIISGRKASPSAERQALWTAAAIVLVALPEVVRTVRMSAIPGGFDWLEQASPRLVYLVLYDTHTPSLQWIVDSTRSATLTAVIKAVARPIAYAWIAWSLYSARQRIRDWSAENPSAGAVIAILLFLPLPIWLFGYVVRPVFILRTILIAVPGFILFLTLLVELDQSAIRRRLTALIIALLFLGEDIAGRPQPRMEPWGRVALVLQENVQSGDLIITCPIFRYPAMRHAMTDSIEAPVFGVHGPDILMVERELGSNPDWQRSYYANISEPILRLVLTGSRSPALNEQKLEGSAPTTAWVVLNKCPEAEIEAIQRWLGRGRWTLIWHAPYNALHAGMDIMRFDADAPRERAVIGNAAEVPARS